MDTQLLTPIVTGSGVAGVFCVLFILGLIYPRSVVSDLKTQIVKLEAALQHERDAAKAAVTAATTTTDILTAIRLGRDIGQEKAPP